MLIAGSIVLLAAIVLGNRIGSHTIFEATRDVQPQPTILVSTPTSPPTASIIEREWKKTQIVRVAADPGFPDPHVSPAPTATPAPTPLSTPYRPRVRATPTEPPLPGETTQNQTPVWRRPAPQPNEPQAPPLTTPPV